MERQEEHWKPIKGFEGLYDVSDQGRVYSYHRNKIRSPGNSGNGYLVVILFQNGQNCGKKIHRIVAEAFIPNPEGYSEVHHKNEIKTDNRVENLEWVSSQYNSEFSKANYYVLFNIDDERIEIYNLRKFARDNGLDNQNLFAVAKGEINSYKGFTKEPGTKPQKNRNKPLRLISPDGEVFTFNNQKEASNFIGASQQNICNLLKGRRKSLKGWKLHPLEGIFAFT